jgi:hypothetical protein
MTTFPSSPRLRRTGTWPAAALTAALLAWGPSVAAQRGPAPTQTGLPAGVLGLACSPKAVIGTPPMPMRITGGQDSFTRRNYQPGDLVTINAGTANGVKVGDEFFVRRPLVPREDHPQIDTPINIRTAGWLRVYAVDDTMSLATISYACDSIEVGDYLEPFTMPVVVDPQADKPKAERDHYARVMTGIDLRRTFGRGDFFIINRGSSDGVMPGSQFVVYRDKREDRNFLFELGEAVAVEVGPTVSTLQVTLSRDAFTEGDLVAQRK